MREQYQELNPWHKASVILSVILTAALIVNTSLMAYINYQDNFQANIMGSSRLESLDIDMRADIGRPSPLMHYLMKARDNIAAYFVGGVEKTNATTGLVVSISGSNIGSTVSVDYYVEAVPQSGGSTYRFLEGNDTSVTVGGADLDLTNQTTIENHLTAMGLSTTASHTIDYYVYVKAEATGAISGDTLVSEITYQKFDTVEYQYGSEVTETLYVTSGANDYYRDWYYYKKTEDYLTVDYSACDSDRFGCGMVFEVSDIPNGATVTECYMLLCGYGTETGGGANIYAVESRENPPGDTSTFDAMTYHTPGAYWSFDTSNLVWQNTPDLTPQMQDIVDTEAWGDTWEKPHFVILDHNSSIATKFRSYEDGNAPELHTTYMSYSSSWYPIGPVSVLSMPLGQALGAITVILVSIYALYHTFIKEEKRK